MNILLVFSNAKEGREEEYNRWYTEDHLGHVLDVEGFLSAQRFERLDQAATGTIADNPYKFLTVYEIITDDLAATIGEMHDRASGKKPGMPLTDSVDSVYASWVFSLDDARGDSELDRPAGIILALEFFGGKRPHGAAAPPESATLAQSFFRPATQTTQLSGRTRKDCPYDFVELYWSKGSPADLINDLGNLKPPASDHPSPLKRWVYKAFTPRITV